MPNQFSTRNPLLKFARNISCICLSDKKLKHCCGKALYISKIEAKKIEDRIKTWGDETLKAAGLL